MLPRRSSSRRVHFFSAWVLVTNGFLCIVPRKPEIDCCTVAIIEQFRQFQVRRSHPQTGEMFMPSQCICRDGNLLRSRRIPVRNSESRNSKVPRRPSTTVVLYCVFCGVRGRRWPDVLVAIETRPRSGRGGLALRR